MFALCSENLTGVFSYGGSCRQGFGDPAHPWLSDPHPVGDPEPEVVVTGLETGVLPLLPSCQLQLQRLRHMEQGAGVAPEASSEEGEPGRWQRAGVCHTRQLRGPLGPHRS